MQKWVVDKKTGVWDGCMVCENPKAIVAKTRTPYGYVWICLECLRIASRVIGQAMRDEK